MNLGEIINKFNEESALNVRATTLSYDRGQFVSILGYFGKDYDLATINKNTVLEYIKHCKDAGNKNSTVNKHLKMVYRLMRYSVENELIELTSEQRKNFSFVYKVGVLKDDCQSYRTLSDHQIDALMNYINSMDESKYLGLRNKIVLSLMLSTGVRRNELVHIKISNIDFENNSIFLDTTKTGNTRYIYFDDEIKRMIYLLLDWMKKFKDFEDNNWLFITRQFHTPLSRMGVDEIFRNLHKALGFQISPHMLRHTFATECVENEIPLSSLQQLMGHTRLSTTQIYIHLANNRVKKDALRYNPFTTRRSENTETTNS